MSSKSETTYSYYCDLCGEQCGHEDLKTFAARPAKPARGGMVYVTSEPPEADVCKACLSQPIAGLVPLLWPGKAQAS